MKGAGVAPPGSRATSLEGTVTVSHEVVESSRVPRRGPYSQAIRLGELLFIADQAGIDPSSGALAGSTFELQARRAFMDR